MARTGQRAVVGVFAVVALVAVAGCSGGSSGGGASPLPPLPTATVTVTATPSPTPTTGAADLFLTTAVRQQLIDAQAAVVGVPDSAYTGLDKGTAYYAYDRDTGTYWAAAGLVPSKHSIRAEVSDQDDGTYLLFTMPSGGGWKVYGAGLVGEPHTPCPVRIPAAVLAVWHWSPNSCKPPSMMPS